MDKGLKPKITVLMPVYNGEKFLRESVESILNQTYKDFEFLIIDDGSMDKSLEILESYDDKRIKIVKNKGNLGLVKSLNKGLTLANGKYIARMDADDIAISDRFEKQLDFMEKNSEIGVCGGCIRDFGSEKGFWKAPLSHGEIMVGMLFGVKTYHPTVIIRKAVIQELDKYYNEEYKHAEDYEFWVRLALKGIKFANIGDLVLMYRKHPESVGSVYGSLQSKNSERIRVRLLQVLGIDNLGQKINIHNNLKDGKLYKEGDSQKLYEWIEELISANNKTKILDDVSLKRELAKKWFRICYDPANKKFVSYGEFEGSYLKNYYNPPPLKRFTFVISCILKRI